MSATKDPTFTAAAESVVALTKDLLFIPSDSERQLKAQFTVALAENPAAGDWESLTPAMVEQLTGDSRIHRMWKRPGLKEWFCNKHEFRAKAEFMLDKMLESFQVIAEDADPRSYGAKVAAAKVLAELSGRSKKAVASTLDKEIPNDPEELKAFIANLEKKVAKK